MTWTKDMDGLLVAVSTTKSRREAIEVVAAWRAVSRPMPAPEPAFDDEPREDRGAIMPTAIGARMVLDGIENAATRERAR